MLNQIQLIFKGYVLSKEALRLFVDFALKGKNLTEGKCNYKQNDGNEDVEMGLCLNSVGVKSIDTRDSLGRHRFLSETPLHWLFSENWPPKAHKYTFYKVKKVMCLRAL